jgi:polysaccharide deacetylase 2 family uncharacterized protein YibQ
MSRRDEDLADAALAELIDRPPRPRRSLAARALGWYWTVLLIGLVGGAVALQALGPPEPAPVAAASPPVPRPAPPPPQAAPPVADAAATVAPEVMPGRDTPGPIPSPDPGLLEPSPEDPTAMLPRISADGRMAMQVYARGFDRSSRRPRVGLLFAGLGLNGVDSEEAIRTLPGGVTLAFSPYATRLERLLEATRLAGHEYLVALPMEPALYPQNDPGDHALMTTATDAENDARLDWALSRIEGYAGVTGALGAMRGERFAASGAPMQAVLRTLAARGLFYVDPRPAGMGPGAVPAEPLPAAWSRAVDLVVDEPAVRTEIDARLAQLEQIARDRGQALGLVGTVRPVTVGRVAAWAEGLADRGFALAPASALLHPPPQAGTQGKP